jgi:hypothetical protein
MSQINSAVNVNIGRRSSGYDFNGIIDEMPIYNRAPSQSEIQSDMNTLIGNLPPIPIPTPNPTPTAGNNTSEVSVFLCAGVSLSEILTISAKTWPLIIFVQPLLQRNAIAINALWYRDRGITTANL